MAALAKVFHWPVEQLQALTPKERRMWVAVVHYQSTHEAKSIGGINSVSSKAPSKGRRPKRGGSR